MDKKNNIPIENQRFNKIFDSCGLTQKAFGEILGRSHNQISTLINGKSKITSDVIQLLKYKFNVNPKFITDGSIPMFLEKKKTQIPSIPIANTIPEGPWKEWIDSSIIDNTDSFIVMPQDLKGKHFFAIRVDDDSMEPLLHKGETLIIDLHKKFRDGLMVVRHHRGHTIRNVYKKSKRKYYLCPLNSKYNVEEITADNNTHFYIPVKVISVRDVP